MVKALKYGFWTWLLVVALHEVGFTQKNAHRKHMPIYDLRGGFRASDWIFEAGASYLSGIPFYSHAFSVESFGQSYTADRNANGRLGAFIGVGRHWMLNQDVWYLESFEATAFFGTLNGREQLQNGIISLPDSEVEIDRFSHTGRFSTTWAGIAFRVNHYKQIGDKTFIRNAVGINAQFLVADRIGSNGFNPGSFYNSDEGIGAQLHWRVGVGFKLNSFTYLIPFAQFHLLSGYPLHGFKGAQAAFNSHYMPILLGAQVKLLRKKRFKGCPTVKEMPGI
jgi:hypothetical protein